MKILDYSFLFLKHGDLEEPLKISVFTAEKSSKGDFSCRTQIDCLGQSIDRNQFGVTPVQAALLAIRFANYLILNSNEYQEGKIFCRFSDGSTHSLRPEFIEVLSA